MSDLQAPRNVMELPPDLPVPEDDGACAHLRWSLLPPIALPSTSGASVNLSDLCDGSRAAVVFAYPRTGVPTQKPNLGFSGETWESIPGARGCTPQSCGFRDLHSEFASRSIRVWGLSTNTPEHQREFRERARAPFHFLSDHRLELTRALALPTFEFPIESGGPTTLLKRMAWFTEPDANGEPRIVRTWYPVFPPDRNAQSVLDWLARREAITLRAANPSDAPYVERELARHWGATQIWSLGRRYDAAALPALVAEVNGAHAGLVTYEILPGAYQCEVVTLSVANDDQGVGSRLLEAAANEARRARCTRVFLTTTNDNLRALGFYQRQGWRLAALHKGNVDQARTRQPFIPLMGKNGITVHDEIELELWLE